MPKFGNFHKPNYGKLFKDAFHIPMKQNKIADRVRIEKLNASGR